MLIGKAKDLSPIDQTSKVMRRKAIDVDFMEVDMGGCRRRSTAIVKVSAAIVTLLTRSAANSFQ